MQSNGITIEYHERGEGDPLLLVMGLGGQLTDWPEGFVDALVARGFRVISFDNRDSGLSTEVQGEPPTRPELAKAIILRRQLNAYYKIPDMAADAIGLLDALEIDEAHVVGMSMGGMIAQQIAIDFPDRVRSLTSIMSTTGNPRVGRPKMRLIRKAMRRTEPTLDNAIEMSIETFRDVCGPTFDADQFRVLAEKSIARSFRPNGTSRQLAAIIASPDRTEALERLKEDQAPLADLAERLGYQSEAAFSRAFKRIIGVSPGAARQTRDHTVRAPGLTTVSAPPRRLQSARSATAGSVRAARTAG